MSIALALTVVTVLAATGGGPAAMIFFTGNVEGYLDQCGCTRFPLGGIDKRSGYVGQAHRKAPGSTPVLLDAGNFAENAGASGELKTRGLVKAMNKMGYMASGVGERELASGNDFFQQLVVEAQFPFISTNLVRSRDGSPWLSPSTILSIGDLRIGVLAVTRHNPGLRMALPDGDAVVTIDPAAALLTQLPRFHAGRDLVVVLATLPLEDARLIARRVPGIDLILGTHAGRITTDAVVEGTTRIVYAGDEGKYLGRVDVYHQQPGVLSLETSIASLGESVPSDPQFTALVLEVLAKAQDVERQRRVAAESAAQDRTYLGSGACSACHAAVVAEWAETAHGHAYPNLMRRGSAVQPGCLACHTTGSGQAGGFIDAQSTPHLVNVGCESCHGPAAVHVAQPERPYGKITLATCTSCHTAEMDPKFNFYQARKLVRHASTEK